MKKLYLPLVCWFLCTVFGYAQGAGCLAFDGVNDYVQVENIWLTDNFSFAIWFKADKKIKKTEDERILSFGPAVKLEIGIRSDSSLWVFDEALGIIQMPNRNVRDGKWHHVAFVKKGPTRYIYLDGNEMTNYNDSPDTRYYPLMRIGVWSGATANQNNYFHGSIDEVKIWGNSLSAVAVKTTMMTESMPNELLLEGYYDFNQDERDKVNPNVVSDRTKSARTGVLVNFDLADEDVKNWQPSNPPGVATAVAAKPLAMMVAQPIDVPPPAPAPVQAPVVVAAPPKVEPPKPEPVKIEHEPTAIMGDITVFDMNGRTVHQINNADLRSIDLSQFMNGMYYFTVKRTN